MARKISRNELILLVEELHQGDPLSDSQLEHLVMELEFLVSNDEAIELLQNQHLSAEEIADQLVGYSDRDI